MSYNFLTLSMTNYLESCIKKIGRLIWDYSITNPLGTFCITKFTLKAFQPAIRNSFSAPLGWHTYQWKCDVCIDTNAQTAGETSVAQRFRSTSVVQHALENTPLNGLHSPHNGDVLLLNVSGCASGNPESNHLARNCYSKVAKKCMVTPNTLCLGFKD